MFGLKKKAQPTKTPQATGFKRFQQDYRLVQDKLRYEGPGAERQRLLEELIALQKGYFSSPEWQELQAMELAIRQQQHAEYKTTATAKPGKRETKFIEQPKKKGSKK